MPHIGIIGYAWHKLFVHLHFSTYVEFLFWHSGCNQFSCADFGIHESISDIWLSFILGIPSLVHLVSATAIWLASELVRIVCSWLRLVTLDPWHTYLISTGWYTCRIRILRRTHKKYDDDQWYWWAEDEDQALIFWPVDNLLLLSLSCWCLLACWLLVNKGVWHFLICPVLSCVGVHTAVPSVKNSSTESPYGPPLALTIGLAMELNELKQQSALSKRSLWKENKSWINNTHYQFVVLTKV